MRRSRATPHSQAATPLPTSRPREGNPCARLPRAADVAKEMQQITSYLGLIVQGLPVAARSVVFAWGGEA